MQRVTGSSLLHPAGRQDGSQGLAHSQGAPGPPAAVAQVAMPVFEKYFSLSMPSAPPRFGRIGVTAARSGRLEESNAPRRCRRRRVPNATHRPPDRPRRHFHGARAGPPVERRRCSALHTPSTSYAPPTVIRAAPHHTTRLPPREPRPACQPAEPCPGTSPPAPEERGVPTRRWLLAVMTRDQLSVGPARHARVGSLGKSRRRGRAACTHPSKYPAPHEQ